MKKIKLFVAATLLIGALAACGTAAPEEEAQTPTNGEIVETPGEGEAEEPGEDEAANDDEEMILIPEMKELEIEVEGQVEKRIAHLEVSDLNYSMFVLEGYSLEAEEPGKDALLMDYDNEFFVRIEPQGKGVNAEEIKNHIIEYAEGTVEEGHSVPLANVEYAVLEVVEDGATAIIHTAKDFNGNLFKFTMFLPGKEAAEGAEPSFWAMLDTISAGE
ncbi:lipoprotein [Alkalihalobacterium sp. APHAB7]|uniref:LptM family lipoprotein n=1 Tax=Alkalihalobacterium sp. APHAB7 TaxID=3402081 RepID=UPI003AB0CBBD